MKNTFSKTAVVAKIRGQSVKLYDERGRNIASIPSPHALSADANGDVVTVRFPSGAAKVYDAHGRHRVNIP